MTQPGKAAVTAWTALIRASENALQGIEAALKAEGLPPLDWYDILWEIEKAGDEGIRPMVLKERVLMRQYAISRLLGRMTDKGYIAQQPCAEDRRGFSVVITPKGRETRLSMWPVYAHKIQALIGQRFSEEELQSLAGLLARIETENG